jgi:serine-type D-Ala-D-Ala carboxypeptidase
MGNDRSEINRRQVMVGIGGGFASTALAPWLLGAGTPLKSSSVLTEGDPEEVGMSSERTLDVFARLQQRVHDGLFPGATALIARGGVIVGQRALGSKVPGANEPMSLDTLFDLESMTKVVATSTSVMILVERKKLKLGDKVATFLPAFAANGKADINVRDMLRYSAGLPIDNQFLGNPDKEAVWKLMEETPLEYPPGTMVEYSDLTYRLLGRLVEVVSGTDLATFAQENIWVPLGMKDTMFNPPPALIPRIAATGYSAIRGYLVRGEVQDEQDFALGGISGCDGVFSTAKDLAIFCQMFMNGGSYGSTHILSRSAALSLVSNQTPQVTVAGTDTSPFSNLLFAPKGYGFELATRRFSPGGMRLSPRSYGKTGGAGTFMWVDPARRLVAVFLTNHGLPVPFDEPGWDRLLLDTAPGEFFDGVINAIDDG